MHSPLACDAISCRRPQWKENASSQVDHLSATFAAGSLTGLCGPDGCGKGLLLNILGCLEFPDSGTVIVQEQPILAGKDICRLRNETFGFLFDHPGLLPSFSVTENVAMPLFRICGGDAQTVQTRVLEVLDFCGISEFESTVAGRLSPANQHLTALARALVHRPPILIAISPRSASNLLPLLHRATRRQSLCVLWAGARDELAPHADRLVEMQNGRITSDTRS